MHKGNDGEKNNKNRCSSNRALRTTLFCLSLQLYLFLKLFIIDPFHFRRLRT